MSGMDGMAGMHEMARSSAAAGLAPMGQHGAAIVGLLFLPIVILVFVLAMQAGSLAGVGLAARFEQGYRDAGPVKHLVVLAMAMSAAIHLSLAPSHFAEDKILGTLFALDGIAFAVLAVGAYLSDVWRAPALALVAVGLLAYAFYLLTGREEVDAVGIFTKLVEIAAALFILFNDRSNQLVGRLTPSFSTEASL